MAFFVTPRSSPPPTITVDCQISVMPKRKRSSTNPSTQTFSLMDGNIDLLQGLVMHREAINEEFERELISYVQIQVS